MASRPKDDLRGKQGSKDSSSPRVDFDNERKSKFDKKFEPRPSSSSGSKKTGSKRSGSRKGGSSSGSDRGAAGTPAKSSVLTPFLRNPVTLEAVANVATPYVAGSRPAPGMTYAIPGAMRLTYGTAPLGTDDEVMRQAMNDQYSFVAHANSRNYNYSPEALMTMELAGIDALTLIALGLRVFGIMRKYDALTIYTPKTLVEACGFNYEDAVQNYSKMPGDLNLLIAKTRQIWIPKSMNYYERWWQLNSTIYVDSENTRDQFYVFVPTGYRKLQYTNGNYSLIMTDVWEPKFGADASGASNYLAPRFHPDGYSDTIKWNEFLMHVNNAIDALLNNQDRGMIYGDLLNAYGADNIISLDYIDGTTFEIGFTYDMTMLTAIMNATLSTFYPTDINLDTTNVDLPTLRQDWDIIPKVQSPEGSTAYSCVPMLAINNFTLNFKSPNAPTSGDIVNATRFVTAGARGISKYTVARHNNVSYIDAVSAESTYNVPRPFTHGSEVITSLWLFTKKVSQGTILTNCNLHFYAPAYYTTPRPFSEIDDYGTSLVTLYVNQQVIPFDWRPLQYQWPSVGWYGDGKLKVEIQVNQPTGEHPFKDGDEITEPYAIIGEFDNVYNVTVRNLVNINIACTQSLAGVPISLTASKGKGKNMK